MSAVTILGKALKNERNPNMIAIPSCDPRQAHSPVLVAMASALQPATVQSLRRAGTVRIWQAGQVVMSRGQPTTAAQLLLSGRLRVSVSTPEGDEQLLRWLIPGEITGLSSVLANSDYPSDLLATETSEVLHIERHSLVQQIERDPSVALDLLRVLGLRVNQLIDAIGERSVHSLEQRVQAALDRFAKFNGVPVPEGLMLKVSQDDIAHAAGASRQRVNIQLRQMQAQGHIRLGYRHVVLLKSRG